MPSGGARSRSGPPVDPKSERSEIRGVVFSALPLEPYDGPVPKFPLPAYKVLQEETDADGRKHRVFDAAGTKAFATRERALWAWAWSQSQAWAWAQPGERWRLHSIAMWVRVETLCERFEATAADKNSLKGFAAEIGLTQAGMAANRWQIAPPATAEVPRPAQPRGAGVRSRFTVVKSDD